MEKDKRSVNVLPAGHQFNLSDFALFLSVMKNKRAYECTLSIILEEEIDLETVKVEQVILNQGEKQNTENYRPQLSFLSPRRISLKKIWQNTHLQNSVKKFRACIWEMEQQKYF